VKPSFPPDRAAPSAFVSARLGGGLVCLGHLLRQNEDGVESRVAQDEKWMRSKGTRPALERAKANITIVGLNIRPEAARG
jgi:hypothetical protein